MFNLVITNYKNQILSAVYEEDKMAEVSLEDKETASMLGNIYVGRVESVVSSINAAFIEIAPGVKGYYSLVENEDHIFLNRKNTNKVCQGDLMLVQVERDAVKTKAPILTSKFNLSGKYIVLTRGISEISISNKIKSKKKRTAIKKVLLPYLTGGYGLIARTNCEELFLEEEKEYFLSDALIEETQRLIEEYENLLKLAFTRSAFTLMRGSRPEYLERIVGARTEELREIITDDRDIYESVLSLNDKIISEKLKFYEDALLPMEKLYRIDSQITDALKERVWLKSGGYLVIQPTEALTVIDVNTGKFIAAKGNREEGFLRVNKEAAIEIARQIRLRNYSGIIVADFIDMKEDAMQQELLSVLKEAVEKDPVKTIVVDITKLGLVELTRKKVKKPLYEQLK
ncbi:MAG: ribonuclease E/G [Thermoflexaceae bacterium]|nr:ribonuclease E/G [Thermoflexaceae bacterium]